MSSIAIILLNYNSTRLTKKCVQSLMAAKDPRDTYHIIVWDNASSQRPTQKDFPEATLINSDRNLGFAGGNNAAVSAALKLSLFSRPSFAMRKLVTKLRRTKSRTPFPVDYLLILNNDTRVTRGMVRRLIDTYTQAPNAGAVVPKIYFEKEYEYHSGYSREQLGKVIWYAGGIIDWKNVLLSHFGVDEVDRGQFDADTRPRELLIERKRPTVWQRIDALLFEYFEPRRPEPPKQKSPYYPTAFATGCCILTTPQVWLATGGFPSKYFMYYEDVVFSKRIEKLRKRIYVEPRAVLFHLNAGSSGGSGSAVHVYYQTRNRLAWGLRTAPMRSKLALLTEARRQFASGRSEVQLAILHALGGRWGKLSASFTNQKR